MPLSHAELLSRLEFARNAALEAGQLILDYFQQGNYSVEKKKDQSPVTAADRGAEQLLRDRIMVAYPRDSILGEEYEDHQGDSGLRWILDPIDGTKSFVYGVPLFGTLIGLEKDGASHLGIIHLPALGDTVYAARGHGAWRVQTGCDPRRVSVSERSTLADSLFVTSQVDLFGQRGAMHVYHELEDHAYATRTWGDCFGYAMVATGRAEIMIDAEVNIWDAAAIQPIIEEAGGRFTDWRGHARIDSGDAIATNKHVHEVVLKIIQRHNA